MSILNNRQKGNIGESIAAIYLKLRFYKILERNFTAKTGEIDIIAKKDGYIIFVEVKYRNNISKGYPREAVTEFKKNQIRKTAVVYMMKNNLMEEKVRFDVIEILGRKIEHIKDAFY